MAPYAIKKYTISDDLKETLRALSIKYEVPSFIEGDPSMFLRHYKTLRDTEVLSFIAAMISFGRRTQFLPIIKRITRDMDKCGGAVAYILSGSYRDYTNDKANGDVNSALERSRRHFSNCNTENNTVILPIDKEQNHVTSCNTMDNSAISAIERDQHYISSCNSADGGFTNTVEQDQYHTNKYNKGNNDATAALNQDRCHTSSCNTKNNEVVTALGKDNFHVTNYQAISNDVTSSVEQDQYHIDNCNTMSNERESVSRKNIRDSKDNTAMCYKENVATTTSDRAISEAGSKTFYRFYKVSDYIALCDTLKELLTDYGSLENAVKAHYKNDGEVGCVTNPLNSDTQNSTSRANNDISCANNDISRANNDILRIDTDTSREKSLIRGNCDNILQPISINSTTNSDSKKISRSRYDGSYYLCDVISALFHGVKMVAQSKTSAKKRINMFLRWMVRPGPVDSGLWRSFSTDDLLIPLDTHVMAVAKRFGLLEKNAAATMQTCIKLTSLMKEVFPGDPAKADFALFGLGVSGD